jgi:hypothetical protein
MSHQHSKDWDLAEAKLRENHNKAHKDELVKYRYELGEEHCRAGAKPCSVNEDYLHGYNDQYAAEQTASAQSREELK